MPKKSDQPQAATSAEPTLESDRYETITGYANGKCTTKSGVEVAIPLFGDPKAVHFVILRHGEKEQNGSTDPALSADGVERINALGKLLSSLRVDVIATTNTKRTIQTGELLYHHVKAPPMQTFAPAAMGAWLQDAISEGAGKTYLHVGHSNTIPQMLQMLNIPDQVQMSEADYHNLFVVAVKEGQARLVRLRYD